MQSFQVREQTHFELGNILVDAVEASYFFLEERLWKYVKKEHCLWRWPLWHWLDPPAFSAPKAAAVVEGHATIPLWTVHTKL